jgi:PAS domain S-box-containing protein
MQVNAIQVHTRFRIFTGYNDLTRMKSRSNFELPALAPRGSEDEEKQKLQLRLLNAALHAITDFVYVLDGEARFLYVNKALLDLWNLTLEEAVGKNFFDLPYPDDLAARLHEQVSAVFRTGLPLSDETSYTSPAGLTGYYEYIFNPIPAADGTVEMIAGTTRDVTARKRRENNMALVGEMQKVLAPLHSPAEILRAVGGLISGHLRLTHCLFAQVDEAAREVTVLYDHCAAGERPLEGVYRLGDFHTGEERGEMAAGETLLINDITDHPRPAEMVERFRGLGIRALANANSIIDGRWKFVLSAQKREAHPWTQEDGELLSQLAARLYLRLERAWSEERLRESEERFRGTYENAGIGIAGRALAEH